MAIFAAIVVRSGGEFSFVEILVAVETLRELYLVLRVFPGRPVTPCAFHLLVLSLERITGRFMFSNAEARGLEPLDSVAAFAFTTVGTFRKLAAVWIGPMAV
jgi:hypothetical protein